MALKSESAKLNESLSQLKAALKAYDQANKESQLEFLALSKAFEVAVEYAWRKLKIMVEDDGLDAPSPKAAVKQAAKIGIISEADSWLACIDARNDSVHDYFGIPESDYVSLARKFISLCNAIRK